ncbi:MAG: lysyl oxidase family protein [Armatimonadota bacterium]
MAQRLPELRAVKGRHWAYSYFGETTGQRYKEYLTDYEVVTDPDELAREGKKHRRHEHLVFSNCVANMGPGVLLLEFTKRSRRRATVEQLIEDTAKPRKEWRRVPVGNAILDTRSDHNHWHFSDFLSYTLRRVGSTTARRSKKQSFCLEDVAKLRKKARGRLFRKCPNPRAVTGEMGITPGWGDVYWAGVQEQYIEVKGLPPGEYWLEMVVDPKKRLKVKSRRYHKTRVKITLG